MDTKVLELLAVFALTTDKRGKICWLNAHNARANGVKPREVIGKRPREVWPEARADEAYDAEVRRTRKPVEHLAWARTRQGRAVWLRVTRQLLPKGRVLTIGLDMTSEVRGAAHRLVTGAKLSAPYPGPSVPGCVAPLLLAGRDATDIAVALDVPIERAFGMLATIAGVPQR